MSSGGINQSALSALTSNAATGINTITGAATGSKAAQEGSSAVQNFMSYMKETPAQRFEDSWLAAHGLTEKSLNAMPAQQREAILKQMAEDMKKQVQQQTQAAQAKPTGGLSSLLG